MTLLHPGKRSLVLGAIFVYMVLMIGTVAGINQGVTATTAANATVDVDEHVENISVNETEPDRPLIPERFESNGPPPQLLKDFVREILHHTLHYANGIGHWSYYNKEWLPVGVIKGALQVGALVPFGVLAAAYWDELTMLLNAIQKP